jgi:hypothetical protein
MMGLRLRSGQAATALILASTALLMIGPMGDVIVGGKDAADTADPASIERASRGASPAMPTGSEGSRLFR